MTRPKTPFEAASYDLIKFRERRVAERRAAPRGTAERRASRSPADANGPDHQPVRGVDGEADAGMPPDGDD